MCIKESHWVLEGAKEEDDNISVGLEQEGF